MIVRWRHARNMVDLACQLIQQLREMFHKSLNAASREQISAYLLGNFVLWPTSSSDFLFDRMKELAVLVWSCKTEKREIAGCGERGPAEDLNGLGTMLSDCE